MLRQLITMYCVRYDPIRCSIDPELLWASIQAAGGSCHYAAAGMLDFYVPERIISFVLLRDSGLQVLHDRSYV